MAEPTARDKINGNPPDASGSDGATAPQGPQPIGVPLFVFDPNTGKFVPFTASVSGVETETQTKRAGTEGQQRTQQYQVPPRYFEGAEMQPANWSPQRIADLQRRMIGVGFIDKKATIHLGVWDETSRQGYMDLLSYANRTGLDYLDALTQYGASGEVLNPNGARQPLTVQTTNPDDLVAAFRSGFIKTLGFGVPEEKLRALAAEYNRLEAGAQKQAYDAQDTGGTIAAPPSPQTFAENKARESDPTGAQEHDTLGFIDQFRQMIGGWQG